MEFREYWQIVWRYRSIVVPLVAVTFVASLIFNLVLPPTYKTDTTVYLQANIPVPPPGTTAQYSEEYYQTVYSEYLADDLSVILKGGEFAQQVADRVESRFGKRVTAKDIINSIATTTKKHRTLEITISTGSEEQTRKIGEALDDVLRTEAASYFTHDDRQPVYIKVVDPPREVTSQSVLRRLLNVVLHSAVALVVGVGLAFLLSYVDDRIRDEDDAVRVVGLPVLGVLPIETAAATSRAGALLGAWSALIPAARPKRPAS